ncbi:MAG: alpha/beta hydrolase, partial [Firmicutes bacterium]|nr:alpha/beta hydrolase [Bacillota bacterium]
LAELAVPLLVLQGSADFQVYADVDYPLWQAELDAAEFTRYQMKLYDGLNHLFMPAKGYTDTSEYMTADHVDPTVIADIADWILSEDK